MNSKPSSPQIDLVMNPDLMKDNFTKCETQEIRLDFDEAAMIEMKGRYFAISTNLQQRLDMGEATKLAINSGLDVHEALLDVAEKAKGVDMGEGDTKHMKIQAKELLQTINRGHEMKEEKLYGFDYQEVSRMAWYDSNGIFVYDRPLKQEEKQTNIYNMQKTA